MIDIRMRGRLAFVGVLMLGLGVVLLWRIVQLYLGLLGTDAGYFAEQAAIQYRDQITVRPPRGEIYDRSEVLLATNSVEYEIGISPVLVEDPAETAALLADAMELPYEDVLADVQADAPFVLLYRPARATIGEAVIALDLDGVVVNPLPRRYYPHQTLAAHVLGFVGYDDTGYYGLEGFYNEDLRGRLSVRSQSRIPFEAGGETGWATGANLRLTIDSEIQFLAESTLAQALSETGAESGTIIVLDPQTGQLLALANAPTFNPNRFYTQEGESFENRAISWQYEPGSTVKALTMAIALEEGTVSPNSTYEDTGSIEVGGAPIYNWDRNAYGTTTMTELLAYSLNVGAARLSLSVGPTRFYDGLERFGFGEPLGIDLQGEIGGTLRKPGNANWFEADLARNSFGQGMASTPLQMVSAFGALANDGLLMRPYLVMSRTEPDGTVVTFEPQVLERAVSAETARTVSAMMAEALETEASPALVEGYRIAGKTGTAQIPIPGGYDPDETIASFIGYGPVDNPRVVVLVKLDRPTSSPWGSQTAAPTFGFFVERLVVLMEIPPDSVRLR
ncbi:MAG: peptidoglycan D,D-transpeptidase FtsI family protein [Anaerolineae bacterium]